MFTQEKALKKLTGGVSVSEIKMEDIEEMSKKYPYFSPIQYLFSLKLKREKHPLAAPQAMKTALFFSNPYWLQFQLNSFKEADITHIEEKVEPENANADIDIPNIEYVKEMMQNIGTSIEKEGLDNSELPDSTEYQYDNMHTVAAQSTTTADKDSKIASMLAGHLADFKKPVDQNDSLESDNLNEKLHTIDYFASQGIKIDLNELPKDKLTTKLLTFTDWLKVMRKSKQANLNTPKNLELENAVAETAQTSVESREVLTETMAEVLVKQGQIEKAIQLFIKLSFSNPEKTAYFASKIQQLKGI
jgi:hypothetical protein